jgi:hypothetical protein
MIRTYGRLGRGLYALVALGLFLPTLIFGLWMTVADQGWRDTYTWVTLVALAAGFVACVRIALVGNAGEFFGGIEPRTPTDSGEPR